MKNKIVLGECVLEKENGNKRNGSSYSHFLIFFLGKPLNY